MFSVIIFHAESNGHWQLSEFFFLKRGENKASQIERISLKVAELIPRPAWVYFTP